ncbi:hypothetical protein KDRO_E06340 [Kluyveromyces lactis]|nr:hypothetical protein KDRO_E06340 [Kluyveromyces lactis]
MNSFQHSEISGHQHGTKTVIVMVGLPARGKSTIAKQIESTISGNCRIFNAGQRRRQLENDANSLPNDQIFDMSDPLSVKSRDEIALKSLKDLLSWLQADYDNHVGIFDATNSTIKRRNLILDTLQEYSNVPIRVVFIEVIVDSEHILEEHLYWKVRQSDDYKHLSNKDWCISDFQSRMKQYETVYETIEKDEFKKDSTRNFPISTFRIINRFEKCSFHGQEPPSFIYFVLLSLQRRWFLEKNAHLPTFRNNELKERSSFFVPWTWIKLRKLL